jgi:hypothetical protein
MEGAFSWKGRLLPGLGACINGSAGESLGSSYPGSHVCMRNMSEPAEKAKLYSNVSTITKR